MTARIDAAADMPAEELDLGKSSGSVSARPALSVVCTVYNEEDAIPELLNQLAAVLSTLDLDSEIIMVDDGSTDRTLMRLKSMIGRAPGLRIVEATDQIRRSGRHLASVAQARKWLVSRFACPAQRPNRGTVASLSRQFRFRDALYRTRVLFRADASE